MQFLITLLSLSWSAAAHVDPQDLKYLFDRPSEPILTLRGLNRSVAYDVPVSYLPERYQRIAGEVRRAARRAGVRLIPVPDLPMPSGRFADVNTVLPYRSPYSRSAPPLLDLTIRFWHFFAESKTIGQLLARGVWARLHFNPEMILDALLLTFLRLPLKGLQDVPLPELPQYFPELYVDDEFFAKAREEISVVSERNRVSIPVLRNLSKDEEAVLWYYREDALLNVFHWKWHLTYPTGSDDRAYVDLPRRGEMFVHLHRQMTGRYNAERFANGLPAVTPIDVHKPLKNGYFPKMVHLHGEKGTIGRQANTSLLPRRASIIKHDREVKLYKDVLRHKSVTYSNGTKVKLVGIAGLDIIGNLLEANSLLSPNEKFYGSMHNNLHGTLAAAHDPLGQYNEPFAVTSYITAVVKDSVFFNIHQFMDNKYEEYKRKLLAPYSKADTTPLPKVVLQSVSVQTDGASKAGELRTFWQLSDLDVSLGLDYTPPGRLYARFTHLQHRRFEYVLKVLNTERHARKVFVRIFLLMTQDETGSELSLDFQRRFSIQMDTFEATCLDTSACVSRSREAAFFEKLSRYYFGKAKQAKHLTGNVRPGSSTLRRASNESALTVDTDAVYASQRGGAPATEVRRRNKCRCGWPQGLLLPRGTAKGMPFKLFAMVTDYHQDRAPKSEAETCHDGWLLCGVPGSTHYPDVRAMGFPFDRPFRAGVRSLGDFLTANMGVSDVVVKFENRTEGPSPLLPGGLSTSWMP